MRHFFQLPAAGPAFFLSAWILMIFAGIVDTDVGIKLSAMGRRWWLPLRSGWCWLRLLVPLLADRERDDQDVVCGVIAERKATSEIRIFAFSWRGRSDGSFTHGELRVGSPAGSVWGGDPPQGAAVALDGLDTRGADGWKALSPGVAGSLRRGCPQTTIQGRGASGKLSLCATL